MWLLSNQSGGSRRQARQDDRFTCDMVTCPLGEVINISATGMRLRIKSGLLRAYRAGSVVATPLVTPHGQIPLRSRVMWSRRRGLRHVEIGVRFGKVPYNVTQMLRNVAMFGFVPPPTFGAAEVPRGDAVIPPHYLALGVSPQSSDDEIHNAYRSLARKHHPDANASAAATDMFAQLTRAYRILRDPETRRKYDLSCGIAPQRVA